MNDLAQTADQVLEAAKENGLSVGDSGFHDHRQSAMAAAESKDWNTSVREYARGISALMTALRQPAPRRASS